MKIFRMILWVSVFLVQLGNFTAFSADTIPITILKKDGTKAFFIVRVAKTEAELQKGLMNVTFLSPQEGMLFDFGKEKNVQMWMKNTYISLDMIFLDNTGRIVYIARNTTPLSLEKIEAKKPVKYVLEIAGGEAAKNTINIGDYLE